MDSASLTLLLFGGALACGFIAFAQARRFGDQLSPLLRLGLRAVLGLCIALGIWASLAALLWTWGLELQVQAVRTGSIGQAWWLGPASLAWAGLSFAELAWNTSRRSGASGE